VAARKVRQTGYHFGMDRMTGTGRYLEQIRLALARMNDVAFLETLSIAHEIPHATEPLGLRLRSFLMAKVEQLKPDGLVSDATSETSSEARQYRILKDRYVLHRPLWETEHKLGLGERQLRREHQRALSALASLVQAELQAPIQATVIAADLAQAVQRLTPSPCEFDLAQLLHDVAEVIAQTQASTARELWSPTVAVPGDRAPLMMFTDRGILHQLLVKLAQVMMRHSLPEHPAQFWLEAKDAHGSGGVTIRLSAESLAATPCVSPSEDDDALLCTWLAQSLNAALSLEGHTALLTFSATPAMHKLLIVDDEPPAIELFRSYVSGLRFEVEAETHPERALARALVFVPHIILIDVMMPAMNGWELLQRLRHAPAVCDVPIIACSVLNEAELARTLGATHFLRKPILRHQLIQALQAVLAAC